MRRDVLAAVRGGLIVSCQAYPGEPMRDADVMRRVAESVLDGGAVGVRAQGLDDLRAIRAATTAPLIGLWKDGDADVYITPTARHAAAVAETGADVVAFDATDRPRPDGGRIADLIAVVHSAGALAMADVSTLDEALAARDLGADVVGTTLAGYTPATAHLTGPALLLVEQLAERGVPVIAEGRIGTPEQAARALDAGALAVVVGSAITHPTRITRTFVAAIDNR
ncbi:N-acetylmannosamine-6-phosphate 2-epimerase [Alloactinosynnema sp. L-07]|uniref:N-acetylmannosamine-6-phosphate 2-epimerase n=1 Tax=Alloactinosynnema sp. L-07 TaxID=1653480 RepID=UPI00065F080E|nr:N-acetylmannosamine-6-phosphate 2-epimerase [Alloactinosynnema sp. L-07]CRK56638.1 N-acetylmannosamine-6-phosphate 2-epimerase [Alloactinosynnema sp. L-07]